MPPRWSSINSDPAPGAAHVAWVLMCLPALAKAVDVRRDLVDFGRQISGHRLSILGEQTQNPPIRADFGGFYVFS